MFTDSSIRDLRLDEEAVLCNVLARKLADIDANRIHATDELVIRKAVFGLLEVVAELERRVIALEGPQARAEWAARLADNLGTDTPGREPPSE
ncbi:hypothetical protein AB0L71_23760 [Streptomyces sp. NPDC052052]|uniref:hypothetical protein n=1 Tax=Streptomyces sp. NPDC052052 TaxID=3154756 RepID=UPI00341E2E6A